MKLRYNLYDEFDHLISSDDSIFHYTKRAIAIERILYEKNYILSSLTTTNDPFEYKSKMIGTSGWGWHEGMENKQLEMLKILDGLLKTNIQFISSCSNSFDGETLVSHGCIKSRMWAQYGENHEGVCLVFSKEKLLKSVRNACDDKKYMFWEGSVDYKEYVADHAGYGSVPVNGDTFDTRSPVDVALDHICSHYHELLFRKQRDYKDEDEYRIVVLHKNHPSEFCSPLELKVTDFLVGIILGDRFPKAYLPTIISISNDLDVKFKKLHWGKGEYILLNGQ